MKTKIKPIISWSIWAGGLSLILGIITHKHLVAGFKADETGMTSVIAALFGAGLIVSFLAAKKLHSEWDILAKIKQTHKIPASKDEQSIAGVFQILDDLKAKGETTNVHTSIDTYHSKHNSRVRSVSIMAALVISMGLLGTVIGLIMSISGLGSMVENIGLSSTSMMVALKATVSGMGTAFYTTFFGALGGLILRAVAVSQLNSLSELCAEAAEYAENNLVSKIDDKNEELNKQVSKVIGSFQQMQHEIEAITSSLSESFKTIMNSFGESLVDAGNHAMEATKESIHGMTDEMQVFSCEIGTSFETLNQTILKSGPQIETAIGNVGTSIEHSGDELNAAFGGLNEMIAKSGEGVSDAFAGMNGTIATAGEGVTESFDSLNGSVKQAGDTVAGSLADFKLSVDGTSLELNDAVGELHSAISQATGEMVTMAKARLDTEATEIAGHLSIAADSIQQYLQQKSVSTDKNQKVA